MNINQNNGTINNKDDNEVASNLDKSEEKINYLTAEKHSLNNTPLGDKSITKAEDATIVNRETVGGKGAALYRMQQAGMKVPEFTTIDVKSIENLENHSLDIASLKPFISDIASFNLVEVNIANIKQEIQLRYAGQSEQRNLYLQGLAKFIANDAFYQQITNSQTAESIRENYNQLIASLPEDSAIIVRSSGIKEDNYGDAQAGKFESLVHGKQDIILTCLQVLASGFQPHVCPISTPQPMSLIIQRCIDCSFGGVAMSRTSLKDHRGKIEFVPGQPKGGVSGVAGVTPHTYLVTEENDKFRSDFTEGNVTSQFILKQQDNNNFEEKPVALTENSSVNLTEEQLKQIYQYIKQGEDMLLCPVDFEFAIAKDGTVYALQLRPLTVLTGGVNFAIDPPENPITTGTLISEGFCAGELFYVQNEQDVGLVPQGAIVVAKHGETWMVDNNQFFKKVGGFIFQQGGANDHIAITMRQQEKPYLVTTDNFDELKHSNAIVSLACGNFKENPGAYVTAGSEFADKLATMQSTVKADYKLRSSEAPVRKTPELYFDRPDIAFKNLHDLNYILLDYFSADSWLTRCFTEKGMLLLTMAPHRIEIIKEAIQEIGQLFADFELFLQGYKQYLQLGIQPGKYIDYLKQNLNRAEKLTTEFNDIKTRVNNHLDNILQQFTNVANQTIPKGNFSQLLQNATKIFADMQKLNIPKTIDEINSLHDIILWIHQEFINDLLPVAINSHLGTITKYEKVVSVIFSDTKENREIEKICVNALKDLKSFHKPKVVIMKNAIIATVTLGVHACTIEMLEQAEAGKGRTLKLKLSDYMKKGGLHEKGKLKRFWFIAQLLNHKYFIEDASEMKASIDEATCMLSIEIPHIKTKEIMLDQFINLIPILNSLKDLDLQINDLITNLDEINWDFAMLEQKIQNLFSSQNQKDFTLLILLLGYKNDTSNNLQHIFNDTISHNFFELGKELSYDKNENITDADIKNILNKIPIKDKEKLLYKLVINCINTIIPFAKTKHSEWFADKKHALKLVSFNGLLLEHLAPDLRNDVDIVLAASTQNMKSLAYAGIKAINNREFVLGIIKFIKKKNSLNNLLLKNLPDELKNHKEFILGIINEIPEIFQHISDNLKKDPEVVLLAVTYHGNNLEHVDDEFKKNKTIVLAAVNNNGLVLSIVSDNLKNDKEVVLAAVSRYGSAIRYASDKLKNDKKIVLAAIDNNDIAITYASNKLKDDECITLAAIKKDDYRFTYTSKRLQNNKEFILKAIKANFYVYNRISKTFQQDQDILQAYNAAKNKL